MGGEPNNSVSLLMLKWDTAEIYNWHYECARDGWEPRSLTYRFADELHDGRTIVPIENYVRNPVPISDGERLVPSSDDIQIDHYADTVKITNNTSGSDAWIMTEVTQPAGESGVPCQSRLRKHRTWHTSWTNHQRGHRR
mgnify:CR=1 FL=1